MKTHHSESKRQKGFNLLDVVIAIGVFSIGILGLSQYQASLVRANSDARLRTMASNIAQQAIETQRRFVRLKHDPDGGQFAYEDITDSSRVQTMGGERFIIEQTVTPYFWSQSTQQFGTSPDVSRPHSDFKLLEVSVAWDNPLQFGNGANPENASSLGSGAVEISSIISSAVTATGRLALIDELGGDLLYPLSAVIPTETAEVLPLPGVTVPPVSLPSLPGGLRP